MKRIIAAIIVTLLLVVLAWLGLSASGLRWASQQLSDYLPGELSLGSLDGRLIGPVNIENLRYQHHGVSISIGQATLDWQPGKLFATSINISQLHVHALEIVLPESKPSPTELTLPELNLPWRLVLSDAQISDITLKQGEQDLALHSVHLNASTLFEQIHIKQLDIDSDQFTFKLNGKLKPSADYRHALSIDWQTRLASGELLQGHGQLSGNIHSTRLQQQLQSPLPLSLDGEIKDILDQLNWQAHVIVSSFDLTQLNSDWPALQGTLKLQGQGDMNTASLTGNMTGAHPDTGPLKARFSLQRLPDNGVKIDEFVLTSPVNNTELHAHGQWTPDSENGNISIAAHWQNLRWPLQGQAWFNSKIGSGWLEGSLDRYEFGLASDRPREEAPPSFWYASADGNRKGIDIHALRIKALDGEVTASGQLALTPAFAWQTEIHAQSVNPESLWPDWPGELDIALTSSGYIKNKQLHGDADITRLTGELRGYPVALQSQLRWRDAGVDIDHLDFHSGSAQITARGRIAETLSLDWTINADDLAELYPEAGGQLHAHGQLSGARNTPTIYAALNGRALYLQDYRIETLDASLNMDWLRWPQLELDLTAESLDLNGQALDSLVISSDQGQINARADAADFSAQLALKGEMNAQGWQGRIEQADLDSQHYQRWQLKAPASLSVTPDTLSLEPLCWQQQNSTLCITSQRLDDHWQTNLDAGNLPLSLLTPWLPANLQLEGSADATADILYKDTTLHGNVNVNLGSGTVSYPIMDGEREHWTFERGKLDITADERGINALSELTIGEDEHFKARLTLPKASVLDIDPQRQPLRGEAQMTVHNLSLIGALLPEVHNFKGEVEVNLATTGTLAKPVLSGQAQLLNGSMRIPRLGLNIDQISLDAQSDAFEKLNFSLRANSGNGTLSATGQTMLNRNAGWPTTITIKGEAFEAARIPEAQVQVSPDLRVKLAQRTINIDGDILIPYARLQPKDITTAARVSNDTVILGAEQPAEEKWSIFTRTRLILGERVHFFGFGFEGQFGGNLLLRDEPGQLTTATGELNVLEGRYRAYGQRLDVEHGQLLYTGGPITNPGLDLRAVRHINEVTAGIKVWGSLNQPQLELFAIPAMGQTDALAYLLLGRPIENASGEEGAMMAKATLALGLSGGDNLARNLREHFGLDDMRVESSDTGEQASLVMGRYLSPKLYISYGVGLIEAFNTLSVRYQISDKWQLKGESGEYQGADLLYTIER